MDTIPSGGMCLSVFLVIREKGGGRVLMGKVNPDYEGWEHIGAISRDRLMRIADRWMLPASHLMVKEAPDAAAHRVLDEQLGLRRLPLSGPQVYSEVYDIPAANIKDHWDIEFIYMGELDREPPNHPAWRQIAFVDADSLGDAEFARNHSDILVNVGVRRKAS
jgi:ADP-ribose pyrophosphatase YjhB (NUDIX family)